jgi:predicted RNA-binding protein
MVKDGKEELVLESVDQVTFEEGHLRLVSIFGEQKVLKARIKRLALGEHKIVLE